MLTNTCLRAAKSNFCHDIVTHESFISRSAGSLQTSRAFSKVGAMGVTDTQHSAQGHGDRAGCHPSHHAPSAAAITGNSGVKHPSQRGDLCFISPGRLLRQEVTQEHHPSGDKIVLTPVTPGRTG